MSLSKENIMGRRKKYQKEIFVMFQEELYNNFQKLCEENFRTKSEVIRELVLKFIKENKLKDVN